MDHKLAYQFAKCSSLAYLRFELNEHPLKQRLDMDDLILVKTFNVDSTQGYIAYHTQQKYYVVAFRGTEKDGNDILSDINFRFVKTSVGRVHRGFLESWEDVEDLIRMELNDKKEKVYVTGHSLGGAIATMAAFHLNRKVIAYTYGSPRIGKNLHNGGIIKDIFRFVYENDIVTRVPFKFLGFTHSPKKMWHLRKNKSPKYKKDKVNFGIFARFMVRKKSFTDHKIANYINNLKV